MIFRIRNRFSDWKFERRMSKQRKKKGFADCDCWGMYYWLTDTFPKMIKNLRDMKHGAPELEFEEFDNFPIDWVAEQSLILLERKRKENYEEEIDVYGKDRIFDRWWFILSRIAWCLEQASEDNEPENEYAEEWHRQVWGEDDNGKNWLKNHLKPIERKT